MKKYISISLVLILLLILAMLFVGCNSNTKTDTKYYTVTFKYKPSSLSVNEDTAITMSFEANKPIGNTIILWDNKTASKYTFYTDDSCVIPWNMLTDIVSSDMILYARWG